MPKPMPDMTGRKHGIGGYNYGCRCEVCREAKRVKRAEYQSSDAWRYQKTYMQRLREQRPEKYAELMRRNGEIKAESYRRNPEKHRWVAIMKKYKMTEAMYRGLLKEQGGVCAICGARPKKHYLSVDHDHSCCPGIKTCGECIRGLLCRSCNAYLGRINDDPSPIIRYLKKYPKAR